MYKCAVTVDIDLVSDLANPEDDRIRFQNELRMLREILSEIPSLKLTLFIRIDSGAEQKYGSCTWFFDAFGKEIDWLRQHGHQLGWHLHSQWALRGHEEKVLEEIRRYGEAAERKGVAETFRIGNSIMTNGIMNLLESAGVRYECSGLPRPHYPWIKDDILWERTGQSCYYPASEDYESPGKRRRILEIPMSTAAIPASYDSQRGVLRYVNPAYRPEVFVPALTHLERDTVMIFHPHEMIESNGQRHELLAYSPEALKANLQTAADRYQCVTIHDYAREFME